MMATAVSRLNSQCYIQAIITHYSAAKCMNTMSSNSK